MTMKKSVYLAQYLRGENEAQHRYLQHRRQLDAQLHLHKAGNIQQQQSKHAQKRAFIVVQHYLAHQRHDDQKAQYGKNYKRAFVLSQLHLYRFMEGTLLPPHAVFPFAHFLSPGIM
jgi:predicted nucleotide-binding protein